MMQKTMRHSKLSCTWRGCCRSSTARWLCRFQVLARQTGPRASARFQRIFQARMQTKGAAALASAISHKLVFKCRAAKPPELHVQVPSEVFEPLSCSIFTQGGGACAHNPSAGGLKGALSPQGLHAAQRNWVCMYQFLVQYP